MTSTRSAKKKYGDIEAQMGIQTESITNKQKVFISLLMKQRQHPKTAYYQALKALVKNTKSVETKLYPGTKKEHFVTRNEASQIIDDLQKYPLKKQKKTS